MLPDAADRPGSAGFVNGRGGSEAESAIRQVAIPTFCHLGAFDCLEARLVQETWVLLGRSVDGRALFSSPILWIAGIPAMRISTYRHAPGA